MKVCAVIKLFILQDLPMMPGCSETVSSTKQAHSGALRSEGQLGVGDSAHPLWTYLITRFKTSSQRCITFRRAARCWWFSTPIVNVSNNSVQNKLTWCITFRWAARCWWFSTPIVNVSDNWIQNKLTVVHYVQKGSSVLLIQHTHCERI